MTVNTVLLTVDRFKELNDFEHDIKSGKTIFVKEYRDLSGFWNAETRVYTNDETVKVLSDLNERVNNRLNEILILRDKEKNEKPKPNFETMSILQFIKYTWSKK